MYTVFCQNEMSVEEKKTCRVVMCKKLPTTNKECNENSIFW